MTWLLPLVAVSTLVAQAPVAQAEYQLVGQVRDVCGRVIPGTRVRLMNRSGLVLDSYADGEGRYAFRQVPGPGPWRLTAELLSFTPEILDDLVLAPEVNHEKNIRLVMDPATVRTVEVITTHAPRNAPPKFVHELVGTVTYQGSPAPGTLVMLRNVSTGHTERCVCDELGRYEFMFHENGPWILVAELPGFVTYQRSDLHLEPKQRVTIDIQLSPAGVGPDGPLLVR
jgi:hypothetical protein